MRRWAALIGAGLMLTGCTIGPPPPPSFNPVGNSDAVVAARQRAGIADCPQPTPVQSRPDGLPELVLDCLGGDTRVRLSDLRGKPMVINLWAQWCGPCRAEAPHLVKLSKQSKGKVAVLGIDYDDPRPDLAVEFASLVGWKYPQLADPNRQLGRYLPIAGIPITLFVDADGKVVRRFTGQLESYEQLAGLVRDQLGVTL